MIWPPAKTPGISGNETGLCAGLLYAPVPLLVRRRQVALTCHEGPNRTRLAMRRGIVTKGCLTLTVQYPVRRAMRCLEACSCYFSIFILFFFGGLCAGVCAVYINKYIYIYICIYLCLVL